MIYPSRIGWISTEFPLSKTPKLYFVFVFPSLLYWSSCGQGMSPLRGRNPVEPLRSVRARIVAGRTGLPVMMEPRLIEQDFGAYEGRSVEDAEYRSNRENLFFRFPGGETTAQLIARAYGVIEDVKRKYRDRSVLLVTHGCLCRAARTYFVEVPPGGFYQFYMNNCDLLGFEV